MSELSIKQIPTLTDPVLIVAFAGWNDAGSAATHAVEFLVGGLQATRFAELDPEQFYDFTEQRPRVRLRDGLFREVTWPANEFFFSNSPALARGVVLGIGIEPQLKWKTYCRELLDLARQCGVTMVITLGALLADVAYSWPVRVVGFSSDPGLSAQLALSPSRYEGPTGIVGVLGDACRRAGLTSLSFWANVPHYISASPNPKAALALVSRVQLFLNFVVDTGPLRAAAVDFEAKIGAAIAENPNMAAYVRQLEAREEDDVAEAAVTEPKGNGGNGHANGQDMQAELRRFLQLRKNKDDDE